ncbi:hypothetical protein Y032_0028g1739 [Ancylostoma ceylanicum]|uniref:Sulfur globule protein CV3 domain protein n=1 Tax=Ancylostoma ceylanicum TaxID=53326 RepID=A0A016UUS1_9BILA|nr:hypothetical protein Y032_0028g1739 [Ancylostoma ceylanicum]
MKLLGALLVLIACLVSLVSSSPVREKRQWGTVPAPPPYSYGGSPFFDYGNFGPGGYYGPYRPYWRRRPTVIEKTVIYRNG